MSTKIKVRYLNNIKRDAQYVTSNVLRICPTVNIRDAHPANAFTVLTLSSDNELQSILAPSLMQKFEEVGLKPTPPPDHFPQRTIFITKLRPYITDRHYSDILREINSHEINPKVMRLHLIPNKSQYSKTLKVIFFSPEDAERACNQGIFMYDISVDPCSIRKDEYIDVEQCFKCFQYSHQIQNCKSTATICSICAQNHYYLHCTNKENPKCVNCEGPHSSVSYSCPIRKIQVKNKVDAKKQATSNSTINTTPPPPDINNVNTFPAVFTKQPQQINNVPNAWSSDNTGIQSSGNAATVVSNVNTPNAKTNSINNTLGNTAVLTPVQPIQSCDHTTIPTCNNTSNIHRVQPHSNIKSHEWEIKLHIWENLASRLSKNNHYKYGKIMNEFLIKNDMTPIDIDHIFEIASNVPDIRESPRIDQDQNDSLQSSEMDRNLEELQQLSPDPSSSIKTPDSSIAPTSPSKNTSSNNTLSSKSDNTDIGTQNSGKDLRLHLTLSQSVDNINTTPKTPFFLDSAPEDIDFSASLGIQSTQRTSSPSPCNSPAQSHNTSFHSSEPSDSEIIVDNSLACSADLFSSEEQSTVKKKSQSRSKRSLRNKSQK